MYKYSYRVHSNRFGYWAEVFVNKVLREETPNFELLGNLRDYILDNYPDAAKEPAINQPVPVYPDHSPDPEKSGPAE